MYIFPCTDGQKPHEDHPDDGPGQWSVFVNLLATLRILDFWVTQYKGKYIPLSAIKKALGINMKKMTEQELLAMTEGDIITLGDDDDGGLYTIQRRRVALEHADILLWHGACQHAGIEMDEQTNATMAFYTQPYESPKEPSEQGVAYTEDYFK